MVNAKVKAVLANEMTPILCVGETLSEREAGQAETKVSDQLKAGLAKVKAEHAGSMVIAYEPIWAIGTGKTASAEDAQTMCAFVRQTIASMYSAETAEQIRIQYGGSVKPVNAAELLTQPDIDGALVGGAALDASSFAQIVQYRLHDA